MTARLPQIVSRLRRPLHRRLGLRILVDFGLTLIVIVAVAAIALLILNEGYNSLADVTQRSQEALARVRAIQRPSAELQSMGLELLARVRPEESATSPDVEQPTQALRLQFEASKVALSNAIEDLRRSAGPDTDRQLLDQIQRRYQAFVEFYDHVFALSDQGFDQTAAFEARSRESFTKRRELDDAVAEYERWHTQRAEAEIANANQKKAVTLIFAVLLVMGGGLGGIVASRLLTNGILSRLAGVSRAADEIRRGDLAARAPLAGQDEIAQLAATLNQMADTVQESRHQLEDSLRQTEQRNRELATLNAVAAAVSQSLDLDEVLNQALDNVLPLLGLEEGVIFLVEEETRDLVSLVVRGGGEALRAGLRMRWGEQITGQVALCGQTLIVDSPGEDPRLTDERLREQLRRYQSFVGVPLKAKGEVVGVLSLASRESRRFAPSTISLLGSVGQQIGIAIENARLFHTLERSEQRLRLVTEGAHDIIFTHDLDGVMTYVNGRVLDLLGRRPEEIVGQSFLNAIPIRRHALALEQFQRSRAAGWPPVTMIQEYVHRDGHFVPVEVSAVPLYQNGKLIGRLGIARDITERRRMERDLNRRNQELSALNAIALIASQSLEATPLLEQGLDKILEVMNVGVGGIALIDDETQLLQLCVGRALSPVERAFIDQRPLDEGQLGQALSEGEALLLNDLADDPRSHLPDGRVIGALVAVPLRARDQVLGVIMLSAEAGREFEGRDVRLLAAIGNQLGIAVANARLFAAERTQRERTDSLLQVTSQVGATLELERILQVAAESIAAAVDVADCAIYLLDAERQEMQAVGGTRSGREVRAVLTRTRYALADNPLFAEIVANRQAIVIPDAANDPRTDKRLVSALDLRAMALIPIVAQDRVLGAAAPAALGRPHTFKPEGVQLAQGLANAVAVAIANARSFEAERRQRERTALLLDVTRQASATLNLRRIIRLAAESIAAAAGVPNCGIYLLDEANNELVPVGGTRIAAEVSQVFLGVRYRLDDAPYFAEVLAGREPRVIDDAPSHTGLGHGQRVIQASNLYSLLMIPLVIEDRVLGLAVAGSIGQPYKFRPENIQLAQGLVNAVAVAIANARSFEAERRQRERTALLLDVTRRVSATLDVRQIVRIAAEGIAKAAGLPNCGIFLVNQATGQFEFSAGTRTSPEIAEVFRRYPELIRADALLTDVLASRQAIAVPDVRHDRRPYHAILSETDCRSRLALPIMVRDQVIGVASLATFGEMHTFDSDAVQLAQVMANAIAVAITNARSFEAERTQRERTTLLLDVTGQVNATLDLRQIIRVAAEGIAAAAQLPNCLIYLLDEETGEFEPAGGTRVAPEIAAAVRRYRFTLDNEPLLAKIVASKQPALVPDVTKTPANPLVRELKIRSCLGLPILVQDRAIGVAMANSFEQVDRVAPEALRLAQGVADATAVAIDNARLFEAERRQRERTALLLRVGSEVNATLELPEIVRIAAQGLADAAGVPNCAIYLLDETTQEIRLAGGLNVAPPVAEALRDRAYHLASDPFLAEVVASRQPVLAPDVPGDPPERHRLLRQTDCRSRLGLPIIVQDRVIGVAGVAAFGQPYRFHPDAVRLAQGVVDAAAVAIANARLYRQARERLAEVQGLQAVGLALVAERSLEAILQTVAKEALTLAGARAASIELLTQDERSLTVQIASGEGAETIKGLRLGVDSSVSGLVISHGRPEIRNDVASEPRADRETVRRVGARTMLIVPLSTRAKVIGTLSVYNKQQGLFTERDAELLTLFGSQAAMAIVNVRLLQQARELAVVQERNRLARELHDDTAQSLTAIGRRLELFQYDLEDMGSPPAAMARLNQIQESLDVAVQDVRRLSRSLRPVILEDLGLVPALEALVADIARHSSIDARLQVEGLPRRLGDQAELTLFRVVQEAVNNAVKHANARRIDVDLWYDADIVRACVVDDGAGFALPENLTEMARTGGMGVIGMRERALALGGDLSLHSAPGAGTTVSIVLPGESLLAAADAPLSLVERG